MESRVGVPQKTKIDLTYDPVIPLLDVHLKECNSGCKSTTCTLMVIAALFTIAKFGNSSHTQQVINGLRKCDIYIYIYHGVLFHKKMN
jgi:hypothetical protein